MQKIILTPEQLRIDFNRRVWAQLGINYDKSTRRFLAKKKADLPTDVEITCRIAPEVRESLISVIKG